MIIIYIDIILLSILMLLTFFACGYCFYRVHQLRQTGQIAILLRPTQVMFTNKSARSDDDQLRTVVACRNPLTGDYVYRPRGRGGAGGVGGVGGVWGVEGAGVGYVNPTHHEVDSDDSGMSDRYEPLCVDPPVMSDHHFETEVAYAPNLLQNCTSKTWNWNYKEYQI